MSAAKSEATYVLGAKKGGSAFERARTERLRYGIGLDQIEEAELAARVRGLL